MEGGHAGGESPTEGEARVGHVNPCGTWDDVVLPEKERERLRSISGQLRRRASGRASEASVPREPGRPVLFLGADGTGKTMAARIIAADLGLPLHELDLAPALSDPGVDLATIVTPAFENAERDGAVLVIDGAGPLLRPWRPAEWHGSDSSRVAAPADAEQPAPDREHEARDGSLTALLESADRHNGPVIFTSTVTHGIDPALVERFDAVVNFPLPETEGRRTLWQRSLPADAQLTASNLDYLANWLKWSGGTIHRCSLAAADEAAKEGIPLRLSHVASVLDQGYRAGRRSGRAPATPPHEPPTRAAPAPVRSWLAAAPAATEPPPSSPARESPPPPESAPNPRVRRRWPVAALGVAAAVIGVIIAVASGGVPSTAGTKATSVDAVRISVPSTWHRVTPSADPSLGLAGDVAVAAPAPARGVLVIGRMAPTGQSVLPRGLLSALGSTVTPQIVKIDRLVFYRYRSSPAPSGAVTQSIYAMPTTAGTVIGVCRPVTASSAFASDCERVLGTLRLSSGQAISLALSASYARTLNSVITRLNGVRSSAGRQLVAATTAHAQAAAATRLEQAHAQAASSLAHLSAGGASVANTALAHALLITADAYRTLAQAAAHNDAHGYRAARTDLAQSTRALTLAFGQLRALGYQVS